MKVNTDRLYFDYTNGTVRGINCLIVTVSEFCPFVFNEFHLLREQPSPTHKLHYKANADIRHSLEH